MKASTMGSKTQYKELKITITAAVSCTSALSNSLSTVDQAYAKDMTVTITPS
jgi:hypothetical protein